ncbi:hypothetical protein [Streptomyces sp. SYSU K21746]
MPPTTRELVLASASAALLLIFDKCCKSDKTQRWTLSKIGKTRPVLAQEQQVGKYLDVTVISMWRSKATSGR